MEFTIQLAQIMEKELNVKRGAIKMICDATGLERHAVSAVYHNRAKYISMMTLGRICEFLCEEARIDPKKLPGILFAENHGRFLEMLAERDRVDVCVGVRQGEHHPANRWIMQSDTFLQSQLLRGIAHLSDGARRHALAFSNPQLIPVPPRTGSDEFVKSEAQRVYAAFERRVGARALVCLGSPKSNAACNIVYSNVFDVADPFESADITGPRMPMYFLYDDKDPHPDSCCGGVKLPGGGRKKGRPGIYFANPSGQWTCLPHSEDECAAMVFYAYWPPQQRLEIALGGFSGVATAELGHVLLAERQELFEPCYSDPQIQVGAIMFRFKFPGGISNTTEPGQARYKIQRLTAGVIGRYLRKGRGPASS